MLKIKISPLQNSEPVSIGKILYTIEHGNDMTWLFKKTDSKIIISRHKDKARLKEFALSYCSTHSALLYIKDEEGNTADIINF